VAPVSEQDRVAEWHQICGVDGSSYRERIEYPRVQTMSWRKAPSDELLTQKHPARARSNSAVCPDATSDASDDSPLTVSEFARFSCILNKIEEAKRALLEYKLDLMRAQLDRSERRDEFWKKTVAPLFNSPDALVSFILAIELPGVCANASQLTVRIGAQLMRSWAGTLSLFTVFHMNWSASGQNDPPSFSSFLPAAPGGSDQIPADARRAFVLFPILGCGTQHEDTTILDCM
jgi:hypothetical protein